MEIPKQIELAESVIRWMISFVLAYGSEEFISGYEDQAIANFICDRQELLNGREIELEKEVDKAYSEYEEEGPIPSSVEDETAIAEMQHEYIGILRGLKDLRRMIKEESNGKK